MMKISGGIKTWLKSIPGLILLVLGSVWVWILVSRSPSENLQRIREAVQEDFLTQVISTELHSLQLVKRRSVGKEEAWQDGAVRLALSQDHTLLDWNESAWMPSPKAVPDLTKLTPFQNFSDKNKLYYFLRHDYEDITLLTLLPLQVSYRVQNANLPSYLFLGRFNNKPFVQDLIGKLPVQLRPTDDAVNIYDVHGNFIYGFLVPQPKVFFYAERVYGLLMAFAGLIWLLVVGFGAVKRKIGVPKASLILAGIVLALRSATIMLHLPSAIVPVKLFSPTILALDDLTPSLGDLFLNTATFLILSLLIFAAFHRNISRVYRKVLTRPLISWLVHIYILGFSVLLITFFFHQLDRITLNSKINFEFSNIFELDLYSILAFVVIGMMLLGVQVVLFHLLRFSYHFLFHKDRLKLIPILISLVCLLIPSFLIWGWTPGYISVVVLSVAITLVILARTRARFVFKLDILNFLLATTLFSMLTSVGILTGERTRRHAEMELIAERLSGEHDLITESLFERVVREVKESVFVLQYNQGEIGQGLKEDFFKQNFKGYDVRIYVYNSEGALIEGENDKPYFPPNKGIALSDAGSGTLTEGLFLMANFQDISDFIYIGEFNLPPIRSLGNLLVQVELWPTEIRPNQLYPNLLVDENIRAKSFVSKDYDYAIYRDNKLFRKHSSETFPRVFEGSENLSKQGYVHLSNGQYDDVLYKASDQKTIQVRTQKKGFFDAANMFSFIFYFNILGFIILMIPTWLLRALREGRSFFNTGLRTKIQALFLSLSIVPLFIVIFLLSPYIKQHIFSELSQNLQDETARVASMVRDLYLDIYRLNTDERRLALELKDRLDDIEKTVFNDVNIYHHRGQLDFTTQPSIYEWGLNSEFMNPSVFSKICSGEAFDQVVEEKIGKLSYFSGYYPLMTNSREVIGYVNIPFLKNQDQVNEQALNLLTFLVDVYVFIFLALGVVAVVISNSIIRPLNLLSTRLEATNLGKMNDPIRYEGRDELGQIIRSYNQMLTKLAESEQKLAQNQREMAWKEMARQVAHEIKNPLTPMKLSVQHLIRAWNAKAANLDPMFEKVTKTILIQIDSLVNIANSFSEFSKMPEPNRSTFCLNEVVREVADLYEHGEKVQLNLHLPDTEFYVHSDRDQLSRVFNNLVKNAQQAIEREDGLIELSMKIEGEEAHIQVRDNGKGIPDDIKKKIFQPNFSTKSSGMGLGLAIVKRIIQSSGGSIEFESTEGEGTTFNIVLPAAEKPD